MALSRAFKYLSHGDTPMRSFFFRVYASSFAVCLQHEMTQRPGPDRAPVWSREANKTERPSDFSPLVRDPHKRSPESRQEADRSKCMINGGGNFCQLAYRAIIVISRSFGLGGQRGDEVLGE